MDTLRRNELVMLCAAGVLTTLGMALVCAALGDSPVRATRGFSLVAALIVVCFLMDLTGQKRDRLLMPVVAMAAGIGLILLWRLDPFRASKQIIWMMMGSAVMLATYLMITDVRSLGRLKYLTGVCALLLLLATMIWGEERYGARLWLDVGVLPPFQPTEIAKLLLAISLAGILADRGPVIREVSRGRVIPRLAELRYLGPTALLVVFCLAIFVTQRDLGAAVLFLGLTIAVLYMGTRRKTYVVFGLLAFALGAVVAPQLLGYVDKRMVAWLNPWSDPSGAGLQPLQAMFALAEGGLLGTGLGLGMPYKMPAVETDLILAAIGEELGLAGTAATVMLLALATFAGFRIAWRSTDRFGMLLAAGLTSVFALQALVITGGVLRLLPLTGITLPFVSYGGTSVIANFIAVGLLLAVSRDCGPRPGVVHLTRKAPADR
ncbi:MAG: FtsW/RodA/SpoVE family cell cycle protein [Armatimonadetes bacterium]|nr:FtsW/RodA/SpoVE family cell cycle protein [Armatimonadota bacterium]